MITIRVAIGALSLVSVGLGVVACKQRSESSAAGKLPAVSQSPARAESLVAPATPSETTVHAASPVPAESARGCCGGMTGMQGKRGMPGMQGMHGMQGMQGMRGMAGMQAMMGTAMMDSMQAHARMMAKMSPDEMAAMVPMHRQMVTNILNQMTSSMRSANVEPSASWTATTDSVRHDLARLPDLTKSQLKDSIPSQCARVSRAIGMYKEMMATKKK